MTALALNFYFKEITCRCAYTRRHNKRCTRRERHASRHMHHHTGVYLWIFKHTVLNHIIRAFKNFFRRLKHEFDSTLYFIFVCFQYPCCTQKHCCMQVMAASMCIPIFRSKRFTRFFCHRQGVHISTQHENASGLFTARHCHNSCFSAILRCIAHGFQFTFYIRNRFLQFKSHTRAFM